MGQESFATVTFQRGRRWTMVPNAHLQAFRDGSWVFEKDPSNAAPRMVPGYLLEQNPRTGEEFVWMRYERDDGYEYKRERTPGFDFDRIDADNWYGGPLEVDMTGHPYYFGFEEVGGLRQWERQRRQRRRKKAQQVDWMWRAFRGNPGSPTPFYMAIMPRARKPKKIAKSALDYYMRSARQVYEVPPFDKAGNAMTAQAARKAIRAGLLEQTGIRVLRHPEKAATKPSGRGAGVPKPDVQRLKKFYQGLDKLYGVDVGAKRDFWRELRRLRRRYPGSFTPEQTLRVVKEVIPGAHYTSEEIEALIEQRPITQVTQAGVQLRPVDSKGEVTLGDISLVDLARSKGISMGTTAPHSDPMTWYVEFDMRGYGGEPYVTVHAEAKSASDVIPEARKWAIYYADKYGLSLEFYPLTGTPRRKTKFTDVVSGKNKMGYRITISFPVIGQPKRTDLPGMNLYGYSNRPPGMRPGKEVFAQAFPPGSEVVLLEDKVTYVSGVGRTTIPAGTGLIVKGTLYPTIEAVTGSGATLRLRADEIGQPAQMVQVVQTPARQQFISRHRRGIGILRAKIMTGRAAELLEDTLAEDYVTLLPAGTVVTLGPPQDRPEVERWFWRADAGGGATVLLFEEQMGKAWRLLEE